MPYHTIQHGQQWQVQYGHNEVVQLIRTVIVIMLYHTVCLILTKPTYYILNTTYSILTCTIPQQTCNNKKN